jgi:hypothetical protein
MEKENTEKKIEEMERQIKELKKTLECEKLEIIKEEKEIQSDIENFQKIKKDIVSSIQSTKEFDQNFLKIFKNEVDDSYKYLFDQNYFNLNYDFLLSDSNLFFDDFNVINENESFSIQNNNNTNNENKFNKRLEKKDSGNRKSILNFLRISKKNESGYVLSDIFNNYELHENFYIFLKKYDKNYFKFNLYYDIEKLFIVNENNDLDLDFDILLNNIYNNYFKNNVDLVNIDSGLCESFVKNYKKGLFIHFFNI